jgi:hypothetical protein
MGTWLVAYQPSGWSTTRVQENKTFGTFFVPRMHAVGSRTATKTGTALSARATMRRTIICMAPTKTIPLDIILRLEARMRKESSHSLTI